jgi:hypothetical protein|tara:strand:- start:494 stop:2029 length:1536 start_codon:yes stop_codon:yes gene_type:complete
MAQTIKIKRSTSTSAPGSLGAGELAYSSNSNKLFIGHPSTNAVTAIGGAVYVNMLDHSAGTLTASSAIVVDSNSKIDQLKTGNVVVTGSSNTISTSSGNLTIAPTSNLVLTHGGTIDLDGQANLITMPDNQAAAVNFSEGGTSYLKFVTTNSAEKLVIGKDLDTTTLNVASGNFLVGTDKFTVATGTGNTVIQGTANVQGAVDLDSTLNVDGNLTANGNVTLGNAAGDTVLVTGTATFTPSADFDGGFTVASSQTVDMGANRVTNVGTPTASTDATTKAYVDSVKQALDIKDSAKYATTADIGATYNNGAGTLTYDATGVKQADGVNLALNDRVLVKNQTTTTENGLYYVSTAPAVGVAGILTRTEDANVDAEVSGGMFCFVEAGSTNADNAYVLTSVTGTATLGTTSLVFTQFSGAGQIDAGNALSKTGNTLAVDVDDKTISHNSGANLSIKGISATANGDLLYGANGTNGGYSKLSIGSYDSTNSVGQILQVGASSTVAWSNTLDGGTF